MKSQMIIKSNIFDEINNYMSIDIIKQVLKWWDSRMFCSLNSKLWTVQHKMLEQWVEFDIQSKSVVVQQKGERKKDWC